MYKLEKSEVTEGGGAPSVDAPVGALQSALSRTGKDVTKSRAATISMQAKTYYGRKIQDIKLAIDQANVDKEAMLDMSPNNKNSIIVVSSFDAPKFAETYSGISLNIRNLNIQMEEYLKDYKFLFGEEFKGL